MGAKVSEEMRKARAIIAEVSGAGKTISFAEVGRRVGLTANAIQKDAECQRLMPGGGTHVLKPGMTEAIAYFEAGAGKISKREAAKRHGVSSAGLTQAIQRKKQGGGDGCNG